VGNIAEIPEVHANSIFRVEVHRLVSYCVYKHSALKRNGGRGDRVGIGALSRPVGTEGGGVISTHSSYIHIMYDNSVKSFEVFTLTIFITQLYLKPTGTTVCIDMMEIHAHIKRGSRNPSLKAKPASFNATISVHNYLQSLLVMVVPEI
jgi:hypothetical protein